MILLQKGIYCAGTVRTNRKLLPKKDVTADKDMKRGEVASYEASGITYVKWMDNKPVLLSNFLSAHSLHEVKRRKKGSKEHEKVCCPQSRSTPTSGPPQSKRKSPCAQVISL